MSAQLAALLVALLAGPLSSMQIAVDDPITQEISATYRFHGSKDRSGNLLGIPDLPLGCMYEGRWFKEGVVVSTREACLSCTCTRGALSCRRRACAVLPDPPPKRCHVLHKRGSCCPELHCPDGIKLMEHSASARFEDEDYSDIATPASIMHACVEGGSVYSAGSAMMSSVACEQCFCLGGARRCVRPRCLPPPAGCRARPAPGACCPQRYYCDRVSTRPPEHKHVHDCVVKGERITEGERVVAAESETNCTQCFCLRGIVRCQPLACAPPLLGCQPQLRPGQCCPHQYHCDHKPYGAVTPHVVSLSENALKSTRYDDRSLHTEYETTTKTMLSSSSTAKNTIPVAATKVDPTIATTKVKRKTNEPPPVSTSKKPLETTTTTTNLMTKKDLSSTTIKFLTTTLDVYTTETLEKATTTEQPEGSIKIMINGTINCTAELSSTSIPLNITLNDTDIIKMEGHPRKPISKIDIEAFTEYPNDIITDRNANGNFDENETFTINVTSSLRTNTSLSTPGPSLSTTSKLVVPVGLPQAFNTSKKIKGDYDYDYAEPTLPPSLPNLKIIPFVAADAVVDDDVSSKEEILTYPISEREDKFPVYYPSVDTKEIKYATRREDVYPPTQYPVFVSEKVEVHKYPHLTQELKLPSVAYTNAHNDLQQLHDYMVSASIDSSIPEVNKAVTKLPTTTSTFALKVPSVNLFSPPVETEGGFIPKEPGIIDEYYAVYPSTQPPVPHLTTSMQLDISKGECISGDGRHVKEGDSISLACSICTCAWSELHCSPRPCHVPPGCSRRPATSSSVDLCCGELICDEGNKTTDKPNLLIDIKGNENKKQVKNESVVSIMKQPEENTKPITNSISNMTSFNQSVDATVTDQDLNIATNEEDTTSLSFKSTTENIITAPTTTITSKKVLPTNNDSNYTNTHSEEYEDEEEDDEGFSFGSVLKLLLSDSYDTTTTPPNRKYTTYGPKPPVTITKITMTPPTLPTTTTSRLPKPILPFVPMPHHPYSPPKKMYQNTVNRIDHLVLGEATAIVKTSPRPVPSSRPIVSYKPVTKTTTQRPHVTHRYTEMTRREEVTQQPVKFDQPHPAGSSALPLPGMLKLAGCNIYGRIYRVGRIITELSTPCQECWCTELGVQCHALKC